MPKFYLLFAISGGSELLARVQYRYLKKSESYLSNIISALVTEDWSGVVSQCTIDSWKEALVATLTHCNNQMPLLCERLGERLQMEASGDADLARNAILCYICAGSTERLVEAWNLQKSGSFSDDSVNGEPDTNNNSNRDLQELVEVAMLLQKALEKQGKATNVTGKLADLLSQYASLLAAQGSLNSALSYVGNSTDSEMEELRERLYYALGHKSITPVQQGGYPNGQRGSVSNQPPPFNPMFPTIGQAAKIKQWQAANAAPIPTPTPVPTIPQPINQPSWNTSPFQGSLPPQQPSTLTPFNQMVPPVTAAPLPAKPPMGPPPTTDIAQPPRPASVSSQTGTTTLGRAKYVLDPSVASGPSYGQTPANLYNQNNFQSTQNYQFNQFANQPINQQPQPTLYNPAQPPQQMGNFKPFTPAPLVQPGVPSYLPGVPPLDVTQPPTNAGYPGAQQAAAVVPPPPLSNIQRNPTPPPGWNDPPALKSTPRAQVINSIRNIFVHLLETFPFLSVFTFTIPIRFRSISLTICPFFQNT